MKTLVRKKAQTLFDAVLFRLGILQWYKEREFAKKLNGQILNLNAEIVSVQLSESLSKKVYIRLQPEENTSIEGHFFIIADDRKFCEGRKVNLGVTGFFPDCGLFVCYFDYSFIG